MLVCAVVVLMLVLRVVSLRVIRVVRSGVVVFRVVIRFCFTIVSIIGSFPCYWC